MALYEMQTDKLSPTPTTTFAAEAILERKQLQRLLIADRASQGEDQLALAKEFDTWADSNRRVDMLFPDRDLSAYRWQYAPPNRDGDGICCDAALALHPADLIRLSAAC